jgi:DinB superfamily
MPRKPSRISPEIALLLANLDEAYERKAWHGPNLRGALRGVKLAQAIWRPAPSRHNIWEIALHAAYWKYAVRRRLTGAMRGSFPVSGSNWFRRPISPAEGAFRKDLALLDAEHRRLREAVARTPATKLRKRPRGSPRSFTRLIVGAAAHDLYHAGQIQLLKVLQRKR